MINDQPAGLLSELYELATQGEFMANCRSLRAGQMHRLTAHRINSAMLFLPLQGSKTVRHGTNEIEVGPGEMLLVAKPCVVDTETKPDPDSGKYKAVVVTLLAETIETARRLVHGTIRQGSPSIVCLPNQLALAPLAAARAALKSQYMSLACHAMVGLVLQLYERGHHALLEPHVESLADRIRAMVADKPACDWAARNLESVLLMSEASIRRHLAAEGTNLRRVVMEARLSSALELLYTTRLPINQDRGHPGRIRLSAKFRPPFHRTLWGRTVADRQYHLIVSRINLRVSRN